jgi:hypothetical protein
MSGQRRFGPSQQPPKPGGLGLQAATKSSGTFRLADDSLGKYDGYSTGTRLPTPF